MNGHPSGRTDALETPAPAVGREHERFHPIMEGLRKVHQILSAKKRGTNEKPSLTSLIDTIDDQLIHAEPAPQIRMQLSMLKSKVAKLEATLAQLSGAYAEVVKELAEQRADPAMAPSVFAAFKGQRVHRPKVREKPRKSTSGMPSK